MHSQGAGDLGFIMGPIEVAGRRKRNTDSEKQKGRRPSREASRRGAPAGSIVCEFDLRLVGEPSGLPTSSSGSPGFLAPRSSNNI